MTTKSVKLHTDESSSMEPSAKSRILKRRELSLLMRELDFWRKEELLTEEQVGAIKGLYAPARGYFSQMLLVLGAMLIGLGILSIIASNWMNFSRLLRIMLIVCGYLASLAVAWRTEDDYPLTSRSFMLLGFFIYGAGIFLIAQMFHSGSRWSDAVARRLAITGRLQHGFASR